MNKIELGTKFKFKNYLNMNTISYMNKFLYMNKFENMKKIQDWINIKKWTITKLRNYENLIIDPEKYEKKS
jgi:hypothetical protein